MNNIDGKNPEEVRPNTDAFSLEEFSITELEDRLEFTGRCCVHQAQQ